MRQFDRDCQVERIELRRFFVVPVPRVLPERTAVHKHNVEGCGACAGVLETLRVACLLQADLRKLHEENKL